MAGAGKKTFTAGEVLTASDVNTYLMEQSVMYFGGTAARASAIPTPSTGMTTYIGTTGTATIPQIETYTGSQWQTPYGLTLVANVSFSSVASIALDNVFTSSYSNYKIICEFTPTTNDNRIISLSLRTSGVDNATSSYSVVDDSANTSGGSTKTTRFFGAGGVTSMQLLQNAFYSTGRYSFDYDVLNPQLAQRTMILGNNIAGDGAVIFAGNYTGYFDANTVFDGFKISSSVANITGTIKVYGLRNS